MVETASFSRLAGFTRSGRLFLPMALLLAAIRVVCLTQAQLPFNGWDELPHMAVAAFVAKTGQMPTARTPMPRELVPFITAHPHPAASLSMLRGIAAVPYPGTDPAASAEPAKRFDMFCYEAQHGPLFYHLAAPFLGGFDPHSLLAWADGVRLANGALLLVTLFLWHAILRRLVPKNGRLGWLPDGIVLLLVSFSYVFFNFVRFSNDALAISLGSVALALYVLDIAPRGLTGPRGLWRYGLLGALVGLAVLAKATALALVPALGLAVVWPGRLPGRRRAALAAVLALAVGYLSVAGWYHAAMLARYGQLTGMQEAVLNARQGFGPGKYLAAAGQLGYGFFRNPILYNATPHLAGWSNLHSPDWQNLGFKAGVTGCLLALGAALLRRTGRREAAVLAVACGPLLLLWAATAAALGYHAVQSAARWGFPTTGGWYGMLALPVTFGLLLLGPALGGRRMATGAVLLLAGLFNLAFMDGVYNVLLAQETGTADLYRAIRQLAAHHALVRLDLAPWLVADVLCLSVVLALGLESVWRPAVAGADCAVRRIVQMRAIHAVSRRPLACPGRAEDPTDRLDRAMP